jgi:hypothetical protein
LDHKKCWKNRYPKIDNLPICIFKLSFAIFISLQEAFFI